VLGGDEVKGVVGGLRPNGGLREVRHPGFVGYTFVGYTIRTQETCRKKRDSSAEFDAQPLKGASDFEAVTASPKRCRDYEIGIAKAIL
jgi:hypothetical protein